MTKRPWGTTRHGTIAGHGRHRKLGERACPACLAAKSAYDARRRDASDATMKARLRARAQMYATTRLRAMYPEDWKILYHEEITRIREEEGLTGDKI